MSNWLHINHEWHQYYQPQLEDFNFTKFEKLMILLSFNIDLGHRMRLEFQFFLAESASGFVASSKSQWRYNWESE